MAIQLSTTFNGVDDKQVDIRIQMLRDDIAQKLKPIAAATALAEADKTAIGQFYAENGLKIVTEALGANQPLDRAAIERQIPKTQATDTTGKNHIGFVRLNDKMKDAPSWSIGSFFKGETRLNKINFLHSLKEKGEEILNDAESQRDTANDNLKAAFDKNWNDLTALQNFAQAYKQAAEESFDSMTAFLSSDAAKEASAETKRALLEQPIAGHKTGLLAIAAQAYATDPKKEGEAIARVFAALNDDSQSLALLGKSIAALDDGDTKKRFQDYLTAFVGMGKFLTFGTEAINVSAYKYAWYEAEKGELRFRDQGGNNYGFKATQGEAETVLDGLVKRGTHLKLGTEAINVSAYKYAWYEAEKGELKFRDQGGNNYGFKATQGEAETVLDGLVKRGTHLKFGTEAINVSAYKYAWYEAEKGELKFRDQGGNNYGFKATQGEARNVFSSLRNLGQQRALKQLAGNRAAYDHAVEAAQALDSTASNVSSSHTHDDGGLMDYLPLLIVGYMLFSSDDHAAAHEIDHDTHHDDHQNDTPDAAPDHNVSDSEIGGDFNDAADGQDVGADTQDFDFDARGTDIDTSYDSTDFGGDIGGGSDFSM